MNTKKGKEKCNFKELRGHCNLGSTAGHPCFLPEIFYMLCQEINAGFVSVPEASAQFASWLAGPFSSVLRMHSAVCSLSYREAFFLWPRLLIPHCKEQQLCFVCGGLCTTCSLICQSHPSLCAQLFLSLKGWLSSLLLRKPSSVLWKSTMHVCFFFNSPKM